MGGFFPGKKFGGPPVSVDNFCALIKDCAECYIVTHNHDMGEITPYPGIKEGWNDRGNAKVMYVTDGEYNSPTFETVINDIQPDYIYLQGLFQSCVMPCLKLAKRYGIRIVMAPRGELCSGAFKKKYIKIPYIVYLRLMGLLDNVVFQSTSEEEAKAIEKYLGASPDQIHLLNNIPSIPFNLPAYKTKESGKGSFVFISRILWKKNLLKAIHCMRNVVGEVKFDIYGPKEDKSYWRQCTEAICSLPPNVRVEYKGVLGHDEIHKTFRQYNAFLFPTLSENYGHVIVEALVSGCIPIISDQTPWNDMNDAGAGWALSLENPEVFEMAIQEVVDMDENAIRKKRGNIEIFLKDKLKIDRLKADYLNVFK